MNPEKITQNLGKYQTKLGKLLKALISYQNTIKKNALKTLPQFRCCAEELWK